MNIIGRLPVDSVRCLVFDIDNTLYYRTQEYFDHGSSREIEEIAIILGKTISETRKEIKDRRQSLSEELKRSVTLTETVYGLGVTKEQWSELRCEAWDPDGWIFDDPQVCELMSSLFSRYAIHFATNCPVSIGEKIIKTIGLKKVLPCCMVYGPESLGVSKPCPEFFTNIAAKLGLRPYECVAIGDREFSDATPAIAAGFSGAIVVPGSRNELLQIDKILL